MTWLIPAPIRRALAWAVAGLAAVWAIRAGAKREARAETALEAASEYKLTMEAMGRVEIDDSVDDIQRWLRERAKR
jgi:hypothetical protein